MQTATANLFAACMIVAWNKVFYSALYSHDEHRCAHAYAAAWIEWGKEQATSDPDRLAAQQGVAPMADPATLAGTWPGEPDDGFEQAVDKHRHGGAK